MHKTWIKDGLSEYLNKNHEIWHMPGHKRKACYGDFQDAVLAYDVTEVPGTDELYQPEGFIRQSLDMLTEIYHTCASYYVVNGATGGIFAAIRACTKPGDAVLIARNCHKSVYNAAAVMQLETYYTEPVWNAQKTEAGSFTEFLDGYVDAADVDRLCGAHPEIRAVVVTSPTYEGVISDIAQIAQAAHAHQAYLIVDEAHGAHLPFLNPAYSAIYMGADIVVQSLHKTLPALTQTALLHVCTRALVEQAQNAVSIFMSSSPSYIFMLNMEAAVCYMADHSFEKYKNNLKNFRDACADTKQFSSVHILSGEAVLAAGAYGYDETRLVFSAPVPGPAFLAMLAEEGDVVCEMAGRKHVVLISTIRDSETAFQKLYHTLQNLDTKFDSADASGKTEKAESMELQKLLGTRAKAPIYVYPPGSYLVNTGEIITADMIETLTAYQAAGLQIRGL